jgi:Cu(I)/Ag(I) efflux system membrane protein CusA/SilA
MSWSARHGRLLLPLALLIAAAGLLARRALSRDALPEISDPQISVLAQWMGHPAREVAAGLTRPIQAALEGVAGAAAVRGTSMSGMARLELVFASQRDASAGRADIVARMAALGPHLPAGVRVRVGPESAGGGWVFQYALVDPSHGETQLTLRVFQDDVLRPALEAIPGVAEVASVGGALQQAAVDVSPGELRARGVAFSDVAGSMAHFLADGPAQGLEALSTAPVLRPGGPATPLRDLARVQLTHEMPEGLADLGGLLPAVGGIVIARPDAHLPALLAAVRRTLDQQRAHLSGGVEIVTVYDRSALAERIDKTLLRALAEEVAVVVLVILLFLLHPRSAMVPLLTLPLVLLTTFAAMWALDVPATVMSLGGIGIALGLAVDADVVTLEACHRQLEAGGNPDDRKSKLAAAAAALGPAVLTSLLITALSFLPVFAFTGETGRLLRPLALTKTLVIAAAALVALLVAPALRALLLRGPVLPEMGNPLTRLVVKLYAPFVRFALARPAITLCAAALAVASCLPIAGRLGGEFLPRIDEGDLLFMPITAPGAPAGEVEAQLRRMDQALAAEKEVATVFGKVGRADTATDPAPFSMVETTVRLRRHQDWPRLPRLRFYSRWPALLRRWLAAVFPEEGPATRAELMERLDRAARLPGWTSAWTAPARGRMDMTTTGVRTPVSVRIRGDDPERVERIAGVAREVVLRVPGTRSAFFEGQGDETSLQFVADPHALAADAVDPRDVKLSADVLLGGAALGELREGGRPMRVRLFRDQNLRGPEDALRAATVRSEGPSRQPIALALLGRPAAVTGPALLRTEGGAYVADVAIDLAADADLAGYVARAQREVDAALATGELRLRPGEKIEFGGQYRLLVAGQQRFRLIVGAVLLLMFGLLYLMFRSVAEAAIVLASVPFALVGSIWILFLLGYPLSAPVWVGLLSAAGLAMQTGVVTVVYIDAAFARRLGEGRIRSRDDIVEAHAEGTVRRLRPKLMTVATMAAGLLPLLWAEGPGAEIMRRVAAPMLGGLATSAFLTLEVLPVLYTIWRHRQLRRAERLGVPLATLVGTR